MVVSSIILQLTDDESSAQIDVNRKDTGKEYVSLPQIPLLVTQMYSLRSGPMVLFTDAVARKPVIETQ